jgi:hypothetical protein
MTHHIVDQKARDMAQAAQNDIAAHARECALQWSQNNKMQSIILRVLAIGTTGLISTMGALIAWLATHPPTP